MRIVLIFQPERTGSVAPPVLHLIPPIQAGASPHLQHCTPNHWSVCACERHCVGRPVTSGIFSNRYLQVWLLKDKPCTLACTLRSSSLCSLSRTLGQFNPPRSQQQRFVPPRSKCSVSHQYMLILPWVSGLAPKPFRTSSHLQVKFIAFIDLCIIYILF